MQGISSKSAGTFQNKNKYNDKELQSQEFSEGGGLEWYDYGARMYDAQIGRFFTKDRFAENSFAASPYSYAANNPIIFIDVNGDSVNIAEEYRQHFLGALESVFGDKAYCFGYTTSGNLVFNGDTKSFSKEELAVFNQLNGIMGEKEITNIVYESSYTVTDNKGESLVLIPGQSGGEVTATTKDISTLSQNYVVIDPRLKSPITIAEVTANYYKTKGNPPVTIDPNNLPPPNFIYNSNVQITPQNATWHGVGHVIHAGKRQDRVLDFDNQTRALNKTKNSNNSLTPNPLPARNPDETHNRLVKKGTGSIFEKQN